jgi:uncharacterized membrane protein HdeD (DUF308 family)
MGSDDSRWPALVATFLGLAFAAAYVAVVFSPFFPGFSDVAHLRTIQRYERPLRFGMAVLSLASFWAGLLRVHGAAARTRTLAERRRDGWILWVCLALALLVMGMTPFLVHGGL